MKTRFFKKVLIATSALNLLAAGALAADVPCGAVAGGERKGGDAASVAPPVETGTGAAVSAEGQDKAKTPAEQ
jgi:hypothetical protein